MPYCTIPWKLTNWEVEKSGDIFCLKSLKSINVGLIENLSVPRHAIRFIFMSKQTDFSYVQVVYCKCYRNILLKSTATKITYKIFQGFTPPIL